MSNLEYVLWAFFALLPIHSYYFAQRDKQELTDHPEKKIRFYLFTMLLILLPTILLVFLGLNNLIRPEMPVIFSGWNVTNSIATIASVLILLSFIFSLKQVRDNTEKQASLWKELEYLHWMLPSTKKERNYFVFGVSVFAGVCEELLFRGYLMGLLAINLPTYMAVILSSIIFGLPHLYQGINGALKTMLLGLAFGLVYWLTNSLIFVIILHIAIDMYFGFLVYSIRPKQTAT